MLVVTGEQEVGDRGSEWVQPEQQRLVRAIRTGDRGNRKQKLLGVAGSSAWTRVGTRQRPRSVASRLGLRVQRHTKLHWVKVEEGAALGALQIHRGAGLGGESGFRDSPQTCACLASSPSLGQALLAPPCLRRAPKGSRRELSRSLDEAEGVRVMERLHPFWASGPSASR